MKRPFLAAVVVAIGISIAGAAVPANAETSAPVGQLRDVASDAPMYGTPRLETAQVGVVHAGESVEAYCWFTNAGSDWVKINRAGNFGYVTSDAIRGGGAELPSTCPTEIETVQVTLYGKKFSGTEAFVTTGRLECPAAYPYLVDDGSSNLLVPPSFDLSNGFFLVAYGLFTQRDGYVTGSVGAIATNTDVFDQTLTISASCTKNAAVAKKA
jgi:hypothetical protein